MKVVKHLKTGNLYKILYSKVIDASNNSLTHGKEMVVYQNSDNQVFVREAEEFWLKFENEPNRCQVCGSTEGLRNEGWYGYRCGSQDCMVF